MFPNHGAARPTTTNQAPNPPQRGNPPPTSATNAATLPDTYADVNGQSVWMTGAELARMHPDTDIYIDEQWVKLSTLLGSQGGAGAPPAPARKAGGFGGNTQGHQGQARQGGSWGNGGSRQSSGSKYNGMEKAEVGAARNPYLPEGKFVILVRDSHYNTGRQHNAQIIEADVKLGVDNQNNPLLENQRVTLYFKQNDSFLNNMKEIVIAASGFDPQGNPRPREDFVSEAEADEMLDGPSPLIVGRLLYVEGRQVSTSTGGTYTRYQFWPCPSLGEDASGDPIPDPDNIPR